MANHKTSDEFDWVTVRRRCSLGVVFDELERQAMKNCDAMPDGHFSVVRVPDVDRFSVTGPGERRVRFDREPAAIVVDAFGMATSYQLTATLTLNDDGECRLLVGGVELQPWQLLRRALEPLFFGGGRA